jgi:hypothetical protein
VYPRKKRQQKKKTVHSSRAIPKKKKAIKPVAKTLYRSTKLTGLYVEPVDEFDLISTGATDDTNMATQHKDEDNNKDKDTKTDKSETRSFQTSGDPNAPRENLTKKQAEEKGLFWKDDPSTKDI